MTHKIYTLVIRSRGLLFNEEMKTVTIYKHPSRQTEQINAD